MSATTPAGQTPYYFVPAPSQYPVMVAFGLFLMILGGGQWVNGAGWGAYSLLAGVGSLLLGLVSIGSGALIYRRRMSRRQGNGIEGKKGEARNA